MQPNNLMIEAADRAGEVLAVEPPKAPEFTDVMVDLETLDWWSKQSGQAQQVLHDSMTLDKSKSLTVALAEFNDFMRQFGPDKVKLWGNGADFDNATLVNCFANANVEPCWKFWNHRCYRTLKSFVKTKPVRLGTYHNALDDAITQAVHAMDIWR